MRRTWHKEDIKAELRKRGTNLHELARQNGLVPNHMSRALRMRFPTYHTVIAEYLGTPLHELWPNWYGSDGQPLGKTRPDARSRRVTSLAAE